MKKTIATWKKGGGKFGMLAPLMGTWVARADSPLGPVRCTRAIAPVLGGAYVQLTARWELTNSVYEELALYGIDENRNLVFWSFTSDGKRSRGVLADVSDIHPQAIGFEAEVPAGKGRMAYFPNEDGGFDWVVEAKTKKGWKRFTEHRYVRKRDGTRH